MNNTVLKEGEVAINKEELVRLQKADLKMDLLEAEGVVVSKTELARLQKADLKMNLLEAGGVDNWTWYGESIYGDHVTPTYDEQCEDIDSWSKQ